MFRQTHSEALSVHAYAQAMGMSVHQVYYLLGQGQIPGAQKAGKLWRIPASAIQSRQYSLLPRPPIGSVQWYDDRYYEVHVVDDETGETLAYDLPSVTTVLGAYPKPFLAQWRGDLGNREADRRMHEAADAGSRIHYACETLAKGGCVVLEDRKHPRFTPKQLRAKEAFYGDLFVMYDQREYLKVLRYRQWLDRVNPEFYATEATVYSIELMLAGTMDGLLRIDSGGYEINGSKPLILEGGVYIMDIKTGSSVHDDHYLQMAAYKRMVEEDGEITVAGALIVHLSSNLRSGIAGLATKLRTADELDNDWLDFEAVHRIWLRTNEETTPRKFTIPDTVSWNRRQTHGTY